MIGQQLGQYEIVAELGQGGMATVYRARQASVGRDVAIKVIKPALATRGDFDKRFNREARMIASLSHPHILKVYDYGEQDGIVYFVMELLSGGTLAERLKQAPIPADKTILMLEQIASALDYAHEAGVVHRDLKPQNILLDARENAFLTDFGIARLVQDQTSALTQSGAVVGTPAYMAPEQWRSETADGLADVYSLGVVAYELLSGRLPFKADTPYGLMHAHIHLPPPLLQTVRSELPLTLNPIFEKALAKDKAIRFTTAAALVEALKQALASSITNGSTAAKQGTEANDGLTEQTMVERTPAPARSVRQDIKAMVAANPFFNRSAIRDSAYFVNRVDELRQILSLLGNGQSVSLVGQRRIGKTSLLFHMTTPEVFTAYGLTGKDHLFVYIDCGSLADLTPQGVYRVLLEELNEAVLQNRSAHFESLEALPALQSAEPVSYRVLERSLRTWLKPDQQLTFILDEFERISRNPALDPDFFSGLRALATRHAIAFVTASKQPLLDLTYSNSSTLSSPFFNIFAAIRLGLLSAEAARTLLDSLTHLAGVSFSEATMATIWSLAGPQPLFLQIAGYEAFELQQAKGAPLDESELEALTHRFLAAVEQHFIYYWHDLTAIEQQVLALLPAAQSSDLETLRALEQKSLIIRWTADGTAHYDYLSQAFERFIHDQAVPGLIQVYPIVIDERRRRVLLHGQALALTDLQYRLLAYLTARRDEVVTNELLEQALWGDAFVEDPERLKSVVKGLRRLLADEANRLENVRGVGYLWRSA